MRNYERPVTRNISQRARIWGRSDFLLDHDLFFDLNRLHHRLALNDDLFLDLNGYWHFNRHLFFDDNRLDNRLGASACRQSR